MSKKLPIMNIKNLILFISLVFLKQMTLSAQTIPIATNQPFLYDIHHNSTSNTTYAYSYGGDEQTRSGVRSGASGFNTRIGRGLNFLDGSISEIIVYDISQETSNQTRQ